MNQEGGSWEDVAANHNLNISPVQFSRARHPREWQTDSVLGEIYRSDSEYYRASLPLRKRITAAGNLGIPEANPLHPHGVGVHTESRGRG